MGDDLLVHESWSTLLRKIHPFFKEIRKSSKNHQIRMGNGFFMVDFCTSCQKTIKPCVGFCEDDHRYCEQCLISFRKCIICSKLISNARQLSRVCFNSNEYYPCWNVYRGCTTVVKRQLIEDHEESCLYGLAKCPFSGSCMWMGNDQTLFAHLQRHHPIFNNDEFKFDMFFYQKRTFMYFRLTAFLNPVLKGFTFYVTYIGPDEEAGRYWYSIRVWHLTESRDYYKFDGFCKSLSANMMLNNCDSYQVVIPYAVVPSYCSDGKIKVDVRVEKIPRSYNL